MRQPPKNSAGISRCPILLNFADDEDTHFPGLENTIHFLEASSHLILVFAIAFGEATVEFPPVSLPKKPEPQTIVTSVVESVIVRRAG